jgi:hypothetical protein
MKQADVIERNQIKNTKSKALFAKSSETLAIKRKSKRDTCN